MSDSRLNLLLEAERRGIPISDADKGLLEEARKRQFIPSKVPEYQAASAPRSNIQFEETVEGDVVPVHRTRHKVTAGFIGGRPVEGEKFTLPPEGEGEGAGFGAQLIAGRTHDPEAKIGVYRRSRVAGGQSPQSGFIETLTTSQQDLAESNEPRDRYRTLPSGEVLRRGADGVFYSETPGTPSGKLKSTTAQLVGDAPKMAAEGVGFLLGGPAGAAGGAVLAEVVERAAAKRFLGEEQDGFIDYVARPTASGALAFVSGGGGKLVGKGITSTTNKALRGAQRTGQTGRIIKNREVIDKAATRQRVKDFERFGLDVSTARATQSSTLAGVERYVGSKTGPAGDIIRQREEVLRKQITEALKRGKGGLPATELRRTPVGGQLVDAAGGVKEALIKRRREQADMLFERAFKEAGESPISTPDTISKLNGMIADAPTDEYKNVLKGFQKALKAKRNAKGILSPPELRRLDKLQKRIGNIAKDTIGKDRELGSEMFELRQQLIDELSKVSPSYQLATSAYKYSTKAIEKFEGKFKKQLLEGLRKTDKDYVHSAPGKLFGPESSPELVRSVKSQVLILKDGQRKWNAIKRGAMSDVIEGLDTALDIPQWKMDILQTALTPKQFEAVGVFKKALQDIGYVPWSQRGALVSEGENVLSKQVGGTAYKLRRATMSPLVQSAEMTANRIDRNAVAIAQELSTTAGVKNALRLKQLTPGSAQFMALLSQIIVPEKVRMEFGERSRGQ